MTGRPERISLIGKLQQEQQAKAAAAAAPTEPVPSELPFTVADRQAVRSQPTPVAQEVIRVDLEAEKAAILRQIMAEESGQAPVTFQGQGQGIVYQETITRRIEGNAAAAQVMLNGQLLGSGYPVPYPTEGVRPVSGITAAENYQPEEYTDEFDALIAGPQQQSVADHSRTGFELGRKRRVMASRAAAIGVVAVSLLAREQVGAAFYHAGYVHRIDLPGMWQALRGIDTINNEEETLRDPNNTLPTPTTIPTIEPTTGLDQEGTP